METNTQAVAAPLNAQPVIAQPVVPAVAKAHQTNVLVEIMEGVTLSALLILFTAVYVVSFSALL